MQTKHDLCSILLLFLWFFYVLLPIRVSYVFVSVLNEIKTQKYNTKMAIHEHKRLYFCNIYTSGSIFIHQALIYEQQEIMKLFRDYFVYIDFD